MQKGLPFSHQSLLKHWLRVSVVVSHLYTSCSLLHPERSFVNWDMLAGTAAWHGAAPHVWGKGSPRCLPRQRQDQIWGFYSISTIHLFTIPQYTWHGPCQTRDFKPNSLGCFTKNVQNNSALTKCLRPGSDGAGAAPGGCCRKRGHTGNARALLCLGAACRNQGDEGGCRARLAATCV